MTKEGFICNGSSKSVPYRDHDFEMSDPTRFQLLRLKCEAYSTLNETDEDPEAESRLQNRMSQGGGLSPPKPTLVAPASLYLTAILE